mgnify:CR=1 FL=1|jgi:hypothetical protein
MYDMIWLEVLFVCVCRMRKEKNQLRETLSEYTVRGGGLNFRVSTYCILYFSTVYCSEGREKNIWRKYTVREVGFSS